MSEFEVPVVEEEVKEREPNPFMETARTVLLASIGAVVVAQEEIEEFVNKLVERGELAEKDGRKLVKDLMERRKQKAERTRGEMGDELEKRVEEMLHRLNVPTKRDVDALSEKISTLSRKVDELNKAS
ncbi:MAG TPA: phasin family protein [Candidatus Binatia bacterium]|nr:phasin family protein [Candidatus Binatia bacterium]